jgi:hypothetical protein
VPRIKKGTASTGAPGYTGGKQLVHNRKDSPAAAAPSSWLRFGAGNERPLGSSWHVSLPGLVHFALNATEGVGQLAAFAARRGLNTARSLLLVVSGAENRPAAKDQKTEDTGGRKVPSGWIGHHGAESGSQEAPFVVGPSQSDGRTKSRDRLARAVEPAQVLRGGGVPQVRAFQAVNGLQSRQSCLGAVALGDGDGPVEGDVKPKLIEISFELHRETAGQALGHR